MKTTLAILFLTVSLLFEAQENAFYSDAYQTIDNMLADKQKYSFKEAVFSVENAYYQGKLNTEKLNRKINFLTEYCRQFTRERVLNYA